MKKTLIVLISALILLGSISIASAEAVIGLDQRVYFDSGNGNSFYWAMVTDRDSGIESTTSGFINYDFYLTYKCHWNSVQVGYIYCASSGRYEEALALRDVVL